MSAHLMNESKKRRHVNTHTLGFLKENVLSVTELTRTNKLSEILNKYADKEDDEVFVIQNNKVKNSQAVLADLEYFERLLKYKEIIDQAVDDYMFNMALERKDEEANLSLEDVFDEDEIDFENFIQKLEHEEEGS